MDGLWTYLCVCVSGVPAYVMSGPELFPIACGSCASTASKNNNRTELLPI